LIALSCVWNAFIEIGASRSTVCSLSRLTNARAAGLPVALRLKNRNSFGSERVRAAASRIRADPLHPYLAAPNETANQALGASLSSLTMLVSQARDRTADACRIPWSEVVAGGHFRLIDHPDRPGLRPAQVSCGGMTLLVRPRGADEWPASSVVRVAEALAEFGYVSL
jgi:hypothetical protein